MDVILAGFNIDFETINALHAASPLSDPLTPETLSAAYARISRNPRPVNELRAVARREVEKARRSNQKIVFDMGHSSVAEHAVFNIDILGVSRLVVEEIEKFRLCSYTEKSQRYIRLEDDFVLPDEIKTADLHTRFVDTVKAQNGFYHELYRGLGDYMFRTYKDLAADPAQHPVIDGWAKEDARYIVSLATEAQLGMTLNARNLELMLRRSAAHPLSEVREFGKRLYAVTQNIAPSLVRYTTATPFDTHTRKALQKEAEMLIRTHACDGCAEAASPPEDITLVAPSPQGDDMVLAALMHSSSDLAMEGCRVLVDQLSEDEKTAMIKAACRHMEAYDAPLREFEYADLTFEGTVSATCFAQLKRHRMVTLTGQAYNPALGVTIPESIRAIGMDDRFMEIIAGTEELYSRIKEQAPEAAPYILTNAHRKRVLMKVNARELYHISRLREDRHAQWDIRERAQKMLQEARKVLPLTLMLATGKDTFEALRTTVMD